MREDATKVIPEQKIEKYVVHYIRFFCDSCGLEVSREDHEGNYAHELLVALDENECVSFFRRRDYCPACLEPVWTAVNKLIKSDPDRERDGFYGDDDY